MWLRREHTEVTLLGANYAMARGEALEAREAEEAPPPPPPTREEAVALEEQRIAEWERNRTERTYMKTDVGWIVIDGYRKRLGPKEGELWATFEEMQRIKAEESSAQ